MNKMYEWSCLYKDRYNTHNDTIIEIRCIKDLVFYIDQYETDIQYEKLHNMLDEETDRIATIDDKICYYATSQPN